MLKSPGDGTVIGIPAHITDGQVNDMARRLFRAFGVEDDDKASWPELSDDDRDEVIGVTRAMIAVIWAAKDAGVL